MENEITKSNNSTDLLFLMLGGVIILSRLIGALFAVGIALVAVIAVYTLVKSEVGNRLSPDEEAIGADAVIHKVGAYPEVNVGG